MDFIVPATNIKIISKALNALSRIGDELYMEARQDGLFFVTFNPSKTVCCKFHFLDVFFSSFELTQDKDASCKIAMKIILPLFKANVDRKLEHLKVQYQDDDDRIQFKMKYKEDDIVMLHNLRLMDNESITIAVSTDKGLNNLAAPSSFFLQLLSMFNPNDEEIVWEISKTKIVARNYCPGNVGQLKMMRTQINLKASEFDTFEITEETCLCFSLKPFRVLIQFAEVFEAKLCFNFDTGGKPLVIFVKNSIFEANFMVATLNPELDADSTYSTPNTDKTTKPVVNGSIFDDLEAKNWDPEPRSKETSFGAMSSPDWSPNEDIIPDSPKTKRVKLTKLIFGACYDPTFHDSVLGKVLAEESDTEL